MTAASRSLNFTAGGFCNLANCSRRVNSFMLSGSGPAPVPRCVPSVRWKRWVLSANAHLFHHGQTSAGHIQQGVFFRRVHGHVIFAAHRSVDELDVDVIADSIDVPIAPLLKRVCGCRAAALFDRVVRRCRRRDAIRFHRVGRKRCRCGRGRSSSQGCRTHNARWHRRCAGSVLL